MIAALGEPSTLVPPLVWETVGRDIGDLVYERLAVLDSGGAPLDPSAYRPGLAVRWEAADSASWRFHLRPGARWQDGPAVTADDVVFSFEAYADSTLDAPARAEVAGIQVVAEDDSTVRVRFPAPRAEALYDAAYHVRIFPRHVWDSIPRARWGADPDPARFVGSGPYRVVEWRRGEWLSLARVAGQEAGIARVMWRFAQSPEAAGNLMRSGEADLLETIPDPARRAEFAGDSALALLPYPSAVYGFLGFNLARPAPWTDPRVRRALTMAVDRATLARAVFGPETEVPPGPMSRQLWLYDPAIPTLPYDPAGAARLLDSAGWRGGPGGAGAEAPRRRGGQAFRVDIVVPATSATRRALAVALQERWRRIGVAARVTVVDFPVFQERLRTGRFETFIGAWLDEPHPGSLADQWTRSGWGRLNYGRYANPAFDTLLAQAASASDPRLARARWREAMDTLNRDAPAIWLYTPSNLAVASGRLELTRLTPFAWAEDLPRWRLRPGPVRAP